LFRVILSEQVPSHQLPEVGYLDTLLQATRRAILSGQNNIVMMYSLMLAPIGLTGKSIPEKICKNYL
jgi:hypothetical protein